MTDRRPCCVPFCGRTTGDARFVTAVEWICGKHWARAPRTLRSLHHRMRRRHFSGRYVDAAIAGRLWERLKRAVVL